MNEDLNKLNTALHTALEQQQKIEDLEERLASIRQKHESTQEWIEMLFYQELGLVGKKVMWCGYIVHMPTGRTQTRQGDYESDITFENAFKLDLVAMMGDLGEPADNNNDEDEVPF